MNPEPALAGGTKGAVPPLRGSDSFLILPSTPPSAPCWAKLFRPFGTLALAFVVSDFSPCGNPTRKQFARMPTPSAALGAGSCPPPLRTGWGDCHTLCDPSRPVNAQTSQRRRRSRSERKRKVACNHSAPLRAGFQSAYLRELRRTQPRRGGTEVSPGRSAAESWVGW